MAMSNNIEREKIKLSPPRRATYRELLSKKNRGKRLAVLGVYLGEISKEHIQLIKQHCKPPRDVQE